MMTTINKLTFFLLAAVLVAGGCKKEEYSFGEIKTPADLTLTTVIAGVDVANPNGNGTGKVTITTTASNTLTYNIDFGDGQTRVVPSGSLEYKYSTPGTNSYTITVNAIGTGGAISTISKRITVFVAFEIPAAVLNPLTGTGSKIWVTDNDAPGHFGVGPNTEFSPIWYAAPPNTREACAYDDEITFARDANNRVSLTIDNKGNSFSIGAATGFYGFSGGDGCYPMSTGGTRPLAFMDATSGSSPAVSTQIQFMVPGNGIINFGTGGTVYEILSVTDNSLHLRNIGADGNSWYQKLKPKP
ncbi:MAG: PKD domain-containing protein [Chitinophagaceae bacterium]|nr:PKD domain-containing protein [Chitinophagaceae bacterium]